MGKRSRTVSGTREAVRAIPARTEPAWAGRAAYTAIALLTGAVYVRTLYPGVEMGDSAELQYMAPLLGICHEPGYAVEIVAGRLFSLLPIGPNIAWRVNLLMAVSGAIGCLALYGAVRRITGRIVGGLTAALTLGFSSIYWTYSLVAEAYVFYGMFLLLGLYAAVRYVESGRTRWLCWTALALGVAVGGRPSELFVLPGFIWAWWAVRRRVRLTVRRLAVAGLAFTAPVLFSAAYIAVRENPRYLHARDDSLRDHILGVTPAIDEQPGPRHLWDSLYYSLGILWVHQSDFSVGSIGSTIERYARLLSGRAGLGDAPPKGVVAQSGGFGTSIGLPGILLAIVGSAFCRARWGWVLLGLTFFLANLVFILWHHPFDNLTFTVPGLSGAALLAGCGAAGPVRATWRSPARWAFAAAGAATVVFLLLTNYRLVNRNTPESRTDLQQSQRLTKAPFPPDSVILTTYWRGSRVRYLLYVEGGRSDVRVLFTDVKQAVRLGAPLLRAGTPTFLMLKVPEEWRLRFEPITPPVFQEFGLLWLNPPGVKRP